MTTCVVAGVLASKAGNGGAIWTRLSWVVGLQRLGFDVVFVEELATSVDEARAVSCMAVTATHFGVDATLLRADGTTAHGHPPADLRELVADAVMLVNISGHLKDPGLMDLAATTVFVDLDPGWTQLWHANGDAVLLPHDHWYTVGTAIGTARSDLPVDLPWRPVVQPVVLDEWPCHSPVPVDRFTTVASWRGFGTIVVGDVVLGPKVHEFRRFVDLPGRVPDASFELALDIHEGDHRDLEQLQRNGWTLLDALAVAGDPWKFRSFVTSSPAEFSVAQGMYVRTRSGWFSDRTTRYLASGRPALVQDTGFSVDLPVGEGLVAYRTPEEAATGAASIMSEPTRHATAARAIAEQHFASDVVLGRFCEEVGVAP